MSTIFKKRNPDVQALFDDAGYPGKVMCIPFDYAKESHTTMICNGNGRQLHGVFDVENNKRGLKFLLATIAKLQRKHHIQKQHIFFGGEDCGSLAANFINALVERGFLVVGINAKEAKDERENSQASTDMIDTIGVAGMMLKMRGRTMGKIRVIKPFKTRLYRLRRSLIKSRTATANRIHHLVNELFPGFLNHKCSGITPFSRASLWLMQERFSAVEIKARKTPALTCKLRSFCVRDPEGSAEKLKTLAKNVLQPSRVIIPVLQRSLAEEIETYNQLSNQINNLDHDMAKLLAQTPGAMLTSLGGIGVRRAVSIYVELADPYRRRNVHSMAALAGIAPRLKQTGGKPAVIGRRNRQCCSILKNIIMSSAISVAEFGHIELREEYQVDKLSGRDAKGRLAQKLLRISLHIIDNQVFFLPPSLRLNPAHNNLAQYYAETWSKVIIKWRDAAALKQALSEGNPLRIWRDMAQSIYNIHLDLKSPQTGRKET
jgi:transposase